MLPYDQYLERFPASFQQLTMESNGKSVRIDSSPVDSIPGPSTGASRVRRAAQLLPADPSGDTADSVRLHLLRQQPQSPGAPSRPARCKRVRAGRGARVRKDLRGGGGGGHPAWLVPHRTFEGNRPSNVLMAERLTPEVLGALVAPTSTSCSRRVRSGRSTRSTSGVSSWGRCSRERIVPELEAAEDPDLAHDPSTNALIRRYRRLRRTTPATSDD